jgi:N-acetylated-alpha-linked acidic dipeptidase
MRHRVEELSFDSSISVNLAPLRAAIKELQFASIKFDHEKHVAERVLKGILGHWRPHKHHHAHQGFFASISSKCRNMFRSDAADYISKKVETSSILTEDSNGVTHHGHKHHPSIAHDNHRSFFSWPKMPWRRWAKKRLIRAMKKVRKVNKKLSTFEQGFIHEDGIKDREWYRHLGVAPGKWLGTLKFIYLNEKEIDGSKGYGATTLPALTEAITIEKNATLATYEAERLQHAIEKMANALRV